MVLFFFVPKASLMNAKGGTLGKKSPDIEARAG
jgi:hypothetical protein